MDGQVLKVWDWSATTGSLQSLAMFGTRMDLVNHQPKGKNMSRDFIMFPPGGPRWSYHVLNALQALYDLWWMQIMDIWGPIYGPSFSVLVQIELWESGFEKVAKMHMHHRSPPVLYAVFAVNHFPLGYPKGPSGNQMWQWEIS